MYSGGAGSSSSEDDEADARAATPSGSEEVLSKRSIPSMRTARLEESEAESEERPPLVQPQDPVAPVPSPRGKDIEMIGAIEGMMHLGKRL